jgi:hypothetical protein
MLSMPLLAAPTKGNANERFGSRRKGRVRRRGLPACLREAELLLRRRQANRYKMAYKKDEVGVAGMEKSLADGYDYARPAGAGAFRSALQTIDKSRKRVADG